MPILDVIEVVLVQCNLVDSQYQQKFEVLYSFTPNKSYVYLLNTDFDEIIIIFTDQNNRPLEIEAKVKLTLLIDE